MIIINAFFALSTSAIINRKAAVFHNPNIFEKSLTIKVVFAVSSLLCPFVGWLSDSYVSRYKVLVAPLYLLLLSIKCTALDVIFLSLTLYCFHIQVHYIAL